MHALRGSFAAVCLAFCFSQPALAEKRVALVIGNAAYENAARLGNPANDAAAITATLKEAGFDIVESRRDLKIADLMLWFREICRQVTL